jgi:hypothetical protein
MAFPRDASERRRFDARWRESVVIQLEAAIKTEPAYDGLPIPGMVGKLFGHLMEPLGGFAALQDAPALGEMLERIASRIWPGHAVGGLLLHLLQLRAAGLPASVNKAIAIELDYLTNEPTDGIPGAGKNERYLRKAWAEFKPTCHLWAAFRLWIVQGRPESFSPIREESIDAFLAISQAFLGLASSLQSTSRRELLLDPSETWRVSRRFELPAVNFRVPPLEDWKLDAIRRHFKSSRP